MTSIYIYIEMPFPFFYSPTTKVIKKKWYEKKVLNLFGSMK